MIFILHAIKLDLLSFSSPISLDLSRSVSFFFVLSGFVLGYTYHRRDISNKRFYISRILRLWPATTSSLLFVLLLLPSPLYLPFLSGETSTLFVPALIANLFLLQSFIPIPAFFFSFNAVAWSVSVEAFFYLCFPFLNKLKTSILFFLTERMPRRSLHPSHHAHAPARPGLA